MSIRFWGYLLLPCLLMSVVSCGKAADAENAAQAEPATIDSVKETVDDDSQSGLVDDDGADAELEASDGGRRVAYEAAIAHLAQRGEETPEKAAIVEQLVASPERLYDMFDGCVDSEEDAGDAEVYEAQRALFYEALPERVGATEIYPLSATSALVTMPCKLGPYWVATANYIVDESGEDLAVRSLLLPAYQRETGEVVTTASNITYGFQQYDEATGELQWWQRYAGHGGCGFEAIYALENDVLTLTQYWEHADCAHAINPDSYPQLYP